MWDPLNPKILPQTSSTCNPLVSDGSPKRDPIYKGPISGLSVMKQGRQANPGRTDAVDFVAD